MNALTKCHHPMRLFHPKILMVPPSTCIREPLLGTVMACLSYMWEIAYLILTQGSCYSDRHLFNSPQSLQMNNAIVPKIGHICYLFRINYSPAVSLTAPESERIYNQSYNCTVCHLVLFVNTEGGTAWSYNQQKKQNKDNSVSFLHERVFFFNLVAKTRGQY
jgi:hypothetical protein